MTARHIAVVNFTRMGDIIQSGPLLGSIVDSNPGSRLTLIVFDKFKDVAERLPMVDAVIGFDVDGLAGRLDSRRCDLKQAYRYVSGFLKHPLLQDIDEVYNLSHTPISATLCILLHASDVHGMRRTTSGRVTVNGDWFNYLLSIMQERRLNPFNLVAIYLRMNPRRGRTHGLEFKVTDGDRRAARELLSSVGIRPEEPYIVLQPGASSESRQWPASAFAELSQRLAGAKLRTVLVGSPEERTLAQRVLSQAQGCVVSVVGLTEVGSLATILQGAQKLVSNDTGTIHLAAAVGTPTIGLYVGPASAKDTAPYGNGHIILEPDLACAPCGYHDTCRSRVCHRSITVDHVFRLITATTGELEYEAARMRGVRVMQSVTRETGDFHLKRLNQPEHANDDELLQFYRRLWDKLLDRAQVGAGTLKLDACEGMTNLRGILSIAQRSLHDIRQEAGKIHPDRDVLTNLLRTQTTWHDALRKFVDQYPLLAPLPRFLLTRVSMLHTDNLNDYLSDVAMTLDLFERGFQLLKSASKSTATLEPVYAATA